MTRSRLGSINPDLATKISNATAESQRKVAIRLTELLFSKTIDQSGATEVRQALEAGQFGDSPLRAWLLDEGAKAERLAKQASQSDDKAGTDHEAARASALKAAHYALDNDPERAALETAYVGRFSNSPGEVARLARAILAEPTA